MEREITQTLTTLSLAEEVQRKASILTTKVAYTRDSLYRSIMNFKSQLSRDGKLDEPTSKPRSTLKELSSDQRQKTKIALVFFRSMVEKNQNTLKRYFFSCLKLSKKENGKISYGLNNFTIGTTILWKKQRNQRFLNTERLEYWLSYFRTSYLDQKTSKMTKDVLTNLSEFLTPCQNGRVRTEEYDSRINGQDTLSNTGSKCQPTKKNMEIPPPPLPEMETNKTFEAEKELIASCHNFPKPKGSKLNDLWEMPILWLWKWRKLKQQISYTNWIFNSYQSNFRYFNNKSENSQKFPKLLLINPNSNVPFVDLENYKFNFINFTEQSKIIIIINGGSTSIKINNYNLIYIISMDKKELAKQMEPIWRIEEKDKLNSNIEIRCKENNLLIKLRGVKLKGIYRDKDENSLIDAELIRDFEGINLISADTKKKRSKCKWTGIGILIFILNLLALGLKDVILNGIPSKELTKA